MRISTYQMLRKMIYIDNHTKSSKTLKDMGFSQSLSRSQEHLPPAKIQIELETLRHNQIGNYTTENQIITIDTFCFKETLSSDMMLVRTV
jgi:hypothetical protein